jgi:cytochrome c peroxidase
MMVVRFPAVILLLVTAMTVPIYSSRAMAAPAAGSAAAEPDLSSFAPLPAEPIIPSDNAMTPAKIELGKQLYFDPRLSINGTIACQSCHNVMQSGTSNLPVPFGVYGKIDGDRQDPTVWNAAFKTVQFWDGRAPSLEEQAKGPLFNPVEMGTNPDTLVSRLKAIPGYVYQFQQVFGSGDPVTVDNAVKAIAAYERTLITTGGLFDQYLRGDTSLLSDAAKRGIEAVVSQGCTSCHFGANFTGPMQPAGRGFFQKFPLYPDSTYVQEYRLMDDAGRYQVTKKEGDGHMWVVQTWRNIELTAPYFHNGKVPDLKTAILVMAKTQLDVDLDAEQVRDIQAFFKTLTGAFPAQVLPRQPATAGVTPLMAYE